MMRKVYMILWGSFVLLILLISGSVMAQGYPTPVRVLIDMGDGTLHPFGPEILPSLTAIPATTTPQPTNTLFPTPTQEPPIPTATPGPTLVPPDLVCYGTITTNTNLNVRDNPPNEGGKLGNWIGTVAPQDRVRILETQWHSIDLWLKIRWGATSVGWVAGYYGGEEWVTRDFTEECAELYELNHATLYPNLPNRFGIHITVGSNADIIAATVRSGLVTSIKATDSTETAVQMAKEANPNVVIVWRELKNGPDDWCQGNAELVAKNWYYWNKTRWKNRGLLADPNYIAWFEYRNEIIDCQPWEIVFDLWMLKQATEDGICLAVFSDAYGNPSVPHFVARRPVLDYILSHPCQPGKYHAVAKHDYEGADSGIYKMGRWLLYLDALQDKVYKERLTWLVTEYGLTYGYGPTDCIAWNMDRKKADQYWSNHPEILTAYHWNVGGSNWGWFDITECLVKLLTGELVP